MEVWWLLSPLPAALLQQPVRLTSLRSGLKAAAVGECVEVKGGSGGKLAALHEVPLLSGKSSAHKHTHAQTNNHRHTHARAVETFGDSHTAAATLGVRAEKRNLHICLGSI